MNNNHHRDMNEVHLIEMDNDKDSVNSTQRAESQDVSTMTTTRSNQASRNHARKQGSRLRTTAVRFCLIRDHHVVLSFTDEHKETRGTQLFLQHLREFTSNIQSNAWDRLLQEHWKTLRHEFPSNHEQIILVECTTEVLRQKLVEEPRSHGFSDADRALYGVALDAHRVIEFYHSRVWNTRIPMSIAEREMWVDDYEEKFCNWQLTIPHRHTAHSNSMTNKMENFRLAIQFVRQWMQERSEQETTQNLIVGHLRLIQKGWSELQELAQSLPAAEENSDSALTPHHFTHPQDIPYPLEYFHTLPRGKSDRLEYLGKIRENYQVWKGCLVATLFRKNVLLAFEKLIQHTAEWLAFTNTDRGITDSTLQMFFDLLRGRWNEFMDKTKKYTPRIITNKRSRCDGDSDDDAQTKKKGRSSDEMSLEDESYATDQALVSDECSVVTKRDETPVEMMLEWDRDTTVESDDFSQVCSGVADSLYEENPLRADASKELFSAVESSNMAKVKSALGQGGLASTCDEFGDTPLHKAAAVGNVEILNYLRLWGSHPWARNASGELALHIACWYGQQKAAKRLWKQLGASSISLSELKDARGRTPMHFASLRGHEGLIRWLCDQVGRDNVVNLRDNDNLTPWHHAKMGGHVDVMQLLAVWGADTSDDVTFDPTSWQDACRTGRLGLAEWLLESSYMDPPTNATEKIELVAPFSVCSVLSPRQSSDGSPLRPLRCPFSCTSPASSTERVPAMKHY